MIALVLWLAVITAVVLVWVFFRQGGYKRDALSAPPGPDWVKTEERFVDPTSGETLDVWFQPRTGERAYVRARRSA
ncbi:hypothetical protein BRADO6696 [Bradyrhizobium sp. ORS 278]|uniref:hypothetical protein n=1 Tax=Bradyrhizobium sp. (strain ORS 278) TaxID=114615 RepID=UPI00015082E2|nr:hypothetical protein [Bradyrhizobium sp. ORS 278]CAL80299.1 hypothetical protein BRADO6696 [Bradyrhizobium sp. ORS 278]